MPRGLLPVAVSALMAGIAAPLYGQTLEFELIGLEINQGVQSLTNAVPLVANRDALVRAYVTARSGRAVTGRLRVERQQVAPPSVTFESRLEARPPGVFDLSAARADLSKTLNFRVPGGDLHGAEATFRLELVVDGEVVPCPSCDLAVVVRRLLPVPPLRLRLVGIRFPHDGKVHEPRDLDWSRIPVWLQRAYPVPDVDYSVTLVDAAYRWPFTCGQIVSQVSQLRAAETGYPGGVDPRTHYYAIVFSEDRRLFMRGCSVSPAEPNPAAVGSGPTGDPKTIAEFAWDPDGSYGDWYAGHEIGHTLGRAHPGLCKSGDPKDPAFQPGRHRRFTHTRLAQSDDPRDVIGLDMRADEPAVLGGSDWHDVMDYCPRQWLSPYTYEAVASRLIAEDDFAAGPPLADPDVETTAAGATAATSGNAPVDGENVAQPTPAAPDSSADLTPTAQGPLLTVIARVDSAAGHGSIDSMVPVMRTYSKAFGQPRSMTEGARLRVVYRGGQIRDYGCDMHPLTPERDAADTDSPPDTPTFDTAVECTFPLGGVPDRATLYVDGRSVVEHTSPRHVVRVTAADASPAAGPGDAAPTGLLFSWTAAGQSPSTRYLVKLSPDDGKTWKVLAVGLRATTFEIAAAELRGRASVIVDVTAIDGMRISTTRPKRIDVPAELQ